MSRAFSFTPFDDTQSSSSSFVAPTSFSSSSPSLDEMNISLEASSDPVYRTMYTPLSPSNSASLDLTSDAPVYRGMTLDYQHLTDEPSFSWHNTGAQPAKQLSLPSLSSFDSSASSSSSSAFSQKLSSLPEIQVVDAASTRPLSPLPAQFDRQFSFLSSSTSTALLAFLSSAFSSPSFPFAATSSLHPRYPSLSVSVQQNNRTVSVAINLFSSSSASTASSSPVVVEFQRRSGDLVLFQSLFASTVELLQSAGHFMAPCNAAFSLSPLSPLSPPSFSRASTSVVSSPSLSVSSAPPSMDDSDDELDLVAISLYKDQALHADNHHSKRDALYALYQSSNPSAVQEAEVEPLFISACQAADVQERELSMQLLAEKLLPSLSLNSSTFARCTPVLLSALCKPSSSVWWQRAASQALVICSHAQSANVDQVAVEKLLAECEDEEVAKHYEEVLDALKQ